MITARKLVGNEIAEYKILLQSIYSGLNWHPPKKNPSNWKEVQVGGSIIYRDDFDQVATFYGLFVSGQQIGGCRVLEPLHKKLEFELYYQLPIRFVKEHRVEVNRFSIIPEYVESPAILVLWITILEDLLTREKSPRVFLPIFSEKLTKLCESLGFSFVDRSSFFKYFPTDPNQCQIMFLDIEDRAKIEQILGKCRLAAGM